MRNYLKKNLETRQEVILDNTNVMCKVLQDQEMGKLLQGELE